jgi:hypothetical protein
MKPVRVTPMEGVFNFAKQLANYPINPGRADALRTELHSNTIVIDTCLTMDTGKWETAVERTKLEGKWIIVEQYPDEKSAKAGHTAWVNILTEFPDYPIKDIDLWSLGL